MKTVDFVGYAPNPGIRRNQEPRKKKPLQNKRNGPKFRSEQEREMLLSNKILDEQDAQVTKIRKGWIYIVLAKKVFINNGTFWSALCL